MNALIFYFIGMGIVCAIITLSIGYVLSSNMRFMQDVPDIHVFKIHTQNTSKIGGVGIFIAFVVIVLAALEVPTESALNNNASINAHAGMYLYIATTAILISGLFKDIYGWANIAFVLIVQIAGIAYFIVSFAFLKEDIHILEYFDTLLYVAFLLVMVNGMNILDGINGNVSLLCLSIFASLCYVGYEIESSFIAFASSLMLGILYVFTYFNCSGRMFLGDSGSFLLGFIISALLVIGIRYYDLSIFYALAISIYPICELLTSIFIRCKHLRGFSFYEFCIHIFEPSNYHLHFFLYAKFGNMASLIIACLYATFMVFASLFYNEDSMLMAISAAFCVVYLVLFNVFKRKDKYLQSQLKKV